VPQPSASVEVSVTPVPARKLGFGTMCAYAFGQVSEALYNTGFAVFLIFYYQQIIGVSGTLTGLAMFVSLIFDAVLDPVIGAVSDRTRTRWGRRHPFIVLAAVPLACFFFALFNPPADLSPLQAFLWLTLFLILARATMSCFALPLTALGAEMARDYAQRSTLYAINVLFSAVGGTIATIVAYRVFFPTTEQFNPGMLDPAGYADLGLYFSIGMVVAIAVCVAGTWREIAFLPERVAQQHRFSFPQLLREVRQVFGNVSFRSIFFGGMLATLVLTIDGVFTPYMGLHFWGLTTEQSSLLGPFALAGLFVGAALVPSVTRWLDKKMTLVVSAFVGVILGNLLITLRLFDPDWFPANGAPVLFWLIAASNFVAVSMVPMIYSSVSSMFADIVDEHELEVGERREGIVFAASSFSRKVTSAVGVLIGGAILDFIHFPKGAVAGTVAPETLWSMGLLSGPASGALVLVGVSMYMGYRLDRERHAIIVRQLQERRDAAALVAGG